MTSDDDSDLPPTTVEERAEAEHWATWVLREGLDGNIPRTILRLLADLRRAEARATAAEQEATRLREELAAMRARAEKAERKRAALRASLDLVRRDLSTVLRTTPAAKDFDPFTLRVIHDEAERALAEDIGE